MPALRQPEERGEEDPARASAGGDGTLDRLPLALGIQTEFCNPARGNEKGGEEGEVGYFRRNHLVPIPQAKNLEELNRLNQHLRSC